MDSQYDRLPALTADLVQRSVDLKVLTGLDSAGFLAAKAALTTIPIIFVTGSDPVNIGLVPHLSHPGGNITGVSLLFAELFAELAPKRVELLHELLPRASAFAVLINPTNSGNRPEFESVRVATSSLGLQIRLLNASTDREIDLAFACAAEMRVDGLPLA